MRIFGAFSSKNRGSPVWKGAPDKSEKISRASRERGRLFSYVAQRAFQTRKTNAAGSARRRRRPRTERKDGTRKRLTSNSTADPLTLPRARFPPTLAPISPSHQSKAVKNGYTGESGRQTSPTCYLPPLMFLPPSRG
jgi:hypothetical protein